jgi:phage head maturation protease
MTETDHKSRTRPQAGDVEERTAAVEVADKRIRGLIPYDTPSRDLGGFTELIEPTAFRSTDISELRCVVDHQGVPLARHPGTLSVEDSPEGLRWSADPPRSRHDVVEAIERGDMRAGSWRMVVGRDRWVGDVRHIEAIADLKDVTIVGAEEPAYGEAACVEYRTQSPPEKRQEEAKVESTTEAPAERVASDERGESRTEDHQERTESTGTLRVEDRVQSAPRGLADAFKSRGWPAERATLEYDEYRATVEFRTLAVSGSIDTITQAERQAVPYGYDTRYVFPVMPQVPVGRDVTSVHVLRQTGRSLASAANVVRDLAAVTPKPETGSTVDEATVSLKQVASIQTNVPNIHLEQSAFRSVIEEDLRHALDGGLDQLVLDTIATAGFQSPGSDPLLVSVRKAISVVQSAGYNPSVLVLRPADSEGLDTLTSGIAGAVNDYVFQPAAAAPARIFGLAVRISKTIPAPAVVDAAAFGKLYISPVSLERFEADSGMTNRSNVRLETHSAFGVERQAAAVRIAAS